jgi:anti-sigma factor (TIGR02949 family)
MDGFLDAEQLARIQSHIDACGGCGDLYHFQARLRHLVGMRCRQAEFPPDLPKRIFGAITDL